MTTQTTSPRLNRWAILLAGILTFVLGALWYSPVLFGPAWERARGYDEAELAKLQEGMGPALGLALVSYLVMAAVLAFAMRRVQVTRFGPAMGVAFLVWIGFVANATITSTLFTGLAATAMAIDAGFQLVYLGVMASVLVLWR